MNSGWSAFVGQPSVIAHGLGKLPVLHVCEDFRKYVFLFLPVVYLARVLRRPQSLSV